MHERRLQTLVKAGLARPYMRDAQDKPYSWVLTDDFEKKVLAFDNESGRKTGLKLLSVHSLEAQLGSHGATWHVQTLIDREVGSEAAKIAKQTGKTYRALEKGMRVEGT